GPAAVGLLGLQTVVVAALVQDGQHRAVGVFEQQQLLLVGDVLVVGPGRVVVDDERGVVGAVAGREHVGRLAERAPVRGEDAPGQSGGGVVVAAGGIAQLRLLGRPHVGVCVLHRVLGRQPVGLGVLGGVVLT